MKVTLTGHVLFKTTNKEEERMLEALHEYLDFMYFC